MAGNQTKLEAYIAEELKRYVGKYIPLKSGLLRRIIVRNSACERLHPNPNDEFCDPEIGPNYEIISKYEKDIKRIKDSPVKEKMFDSSLIVERMYPDGYMLLNGHHRWAAAMQMGVKRVPVHITNPTRADDIQKMLKKARHNKRVTLDLDEVIFVYDAQEKAEKELCFPFNRFYRARLRSGVPALFHYLKTSGYDIWVYTDRYFSLEHIRHYFKLYHARVDGIVTGTAGKSRADADERKKLQAQFAVQYPVTLNIDLRSVVRVDEKAHNYQQYDLTGNADTWSREVMEIVGAIEKNEE